VFFYFNLWRKKVMKKIYLLLGILLSSVAWFAVGCGIPQEDYDDVLAQLSTLQQELQVVKADFEASRAKVSDLTANQEKLNSELTATQTKLSETGAELEKTKSQLEAIKAELKTTQHELELAKKELPAFQQDLSTKYGSLYGLLGLNDALSALTRAVLLNQKAEIPALAATVRTRIAPSAVQYMSLWEQAYVVDATGWKLTYAPLAELIKEVNEAILNQRNAVRSMLP
jgi:peptidoglycan hydrolase CwlO-like protein